MKSSRVIRFALRVVATVAPLVPRAGRADWRRQWEADLTHQWVFVRAGRPPMAAALDLMWRVRGTLSHALFLRFRSVHMPTFLHDVRFGIRALVKRPGFSLVAVLLLALGVAANTTIFSWVDAILLRPLSGVPDVGRIVSIHGTTLTRNDISVSYPNFADMRERLPSSLAGMSAFRLVPLNLRVGDEPERGWGELVTADFFQTLGVVPLHGRLLVPDDDRAPNASAVVALSHRYWQRRFVGSLDVIGQPLTINGTAFTIVGIAPESFTAGSPAMSVDVWVPMMMQQAVRPGNAIAPEARGNAWLTVIARLAPDADLASAQAGLSVVAAQLEAEHPVNEDRGVMLYPLWLDPQSAAGEIGPVFLVLMVVAGAVLLIVCANLANLLLVRGSSRSHEIAVRLALGSGRLRVMRQLLTESLLLAIAGGLAGFVVTLWSSQLLRTLVPPTPLPIDASVAIGWRVAGVSFGLAAATIILFGLLPALQASRPALIATLRESRGVIGAGRKWLRGALIVGQVALACLLLVSAGLFVRTYQNVQAADPGFDMRRGFMASVDLQPGGYEAARGRALFKQLLEEVEAVPGVVSAALMREVPLRLGGGSDTTVEIEGYEPAEGEEITIYYDRVSPGAFETLGIRLVAGRTFTDADDPDHPSVVVINETMARRYFPDGEAVGRRLRLGDWVTVAGVVADATYRTPGSTTMPYMYLPVYTYYRPDTTLVVRTAADSVAVIEPVRQVMLGLDANLPLFDVRTMAEHRDMAFFISRLAALLLGAFGLTALALAAVGLYGLLAYLVGQRVPEIGIRVALGAERRDIRRLVVWEGLRLALVGTAVGLGLAALLLPLAASQFVGVSAIDGLSYLGAVALLVVSALAACYLPARRASGVEPMIALRYE